MDLDEAYKIKGEAITQIELWQGKLQNANQFIRAHLSGKFKEPVKQEPKAEVPPTEGCASD